MSAAPPSPLGAPTSPSQYAAYRAGSVPPPERVADGITAIAIPLGHRYLPFVLCYAIEDSEGGVHLVDAGRMDDDSLHHLEHDLASIGTPLERVVSVTATHLHTDHLGLAEAIRERTGARIALHRLDQDALHAGFPEVEPYLRAWGVPPERWADVGELPRVVPPIEADVLFEDGDRLDVPGRDLRIVHTPGHTVGSSCIVDAAARVILTGDTLLPDQFPGLGAGGDPGTNPIRDYLHSLDRLREWDDHEVLPGHGWRFAGLVERVDATLAHHRRRTAEVETVLAAAPELTNWELASRLTWTAGWENLRSFYARSALAQTAWHRELVEGGPR